MTPRAKIYLPQELTAIEALDTAINYLKHNCCETSCCRDRWENSEDNGVCCSCEAWDIVDVLTKAIAGINGAVAQRQRQTPQKRPSERSNRSSTTKK